MKQLFLSLLTLLLFTQARAQPASCFSMYVSTEAAVPGEVVCLDVTAEGIDNLASFQYVLRWDTSALRFDHLENFNLPSLDTSSFNTQPFAVDNGQLRVSWLDFGLSGVDVSNGQVAYSVCFEALNAPAGLHTVYFSDTPIRFEFSNTNGELIDNYSLINGGAFTGVGTAPAISGACALLAGCQGGTIDIAVSGGQPDYIYNWEQDGTTVSTAEDLSSNSPGSYSLQVADAQGLEASGIFHLQGGDEETRYGYDCFGNEADLWSTVALGGSPPFTFSWNTGLVETNQYGSVLRRVPIAGDYSVTISDAAGCLVGMHAFELDCNQANPFLTAYTYECRFFGGDSSLADVTLAVWSGGTPPYTFEWSNGEVGVDSIFSVNEGLVNGTYSVTITDANGQVHIPQPAIVDCEPAPQDFIVGSNYECTFFPSEDSVSIDISALVWAGPQPPYTFAWSTGEVQTDSLLSTVTVSAAGAYSVTITDAAGHSHLEPVYVPGCGLPASLLSIEEASGLSGEVVCVEVSAAEMHDLDSLLMAIKWLPWFMELESVQPGLITSGFDLSDAGSGLFQLGWNSGGTPIDISGEAPLFQLCFRLLPPAGQSIAINFHPIVQAPEAYDSNGQPISFEWLNGAVLVESGNPSEAVQLIAGSASADPGASVCLDISTANFTDVVSAQFTVRWDTAGLRFDSLLLGDLQGLTLSNNFNLNDAGNGFLRFAWFPASLEPVTLPDGASLFTLCFATSPLPGISAVSISSVPTLIEVTDGLDILPVAVVNGSVVTLEPEIWPGDTDADENVNHFDLLNIGLAYGAAGPPRPNASIGWVQQPAAGWQQSTPLSLVNYKHIDADGNGLIEAADTLAIVQNWGLETGEENRPAPDVEFARQLPTVLYVKPDTVTLGEPAVFDVILGNETAPAEDIYGLAFTIVYDTAAVEPGSASMAFGNSWIGQQTQDLLALGRDNYNNGRIDAALTRTDGQNVSGQGPIAQLHITIQDVIFRGGEYEMLLDIENVRLINSAEEWAEVVSQPSTVAIGGVSSADDKARKADIKAWPVPAKDRIFIYSPHYPVQQVEVLGMDGRSLLTKQQVNQLSVAHLPAGPYFLRIWTEAGVSVRRMVLVR